MTAGVTKTVKKRLTKFLLSLIIVSIAVLLIVYNLRDNIVYFYSPSDLIEENLNRGQIIRLGGLVETDSVFNESESIFHFKVSDGNEHINVKYEGILPNLFADDNGVVVAGI